MNSTETSLDRKLGTFETHWCEKERNKRLAPKTPALPDLTPQEKDWLKAHYKTEWKFLVLHGLKIDVPEQRAEGRELLKQLAAEDSKGERKFDDDTSDISLPGLTAKERAWIKTHYETELNFLVLHECRIDDPEDRSNARMILRALMHEEEAQKEEIESEADLYGESDTEY